MSKPIIVIGDATSHGGRVITGDATWIVEGRRAARVGDLTVCPRCKGVFPITTGASNATSFEQAWACPGDKTACGASLISSQQTTTWDLNSDLVEFEIADREAVEALRSAAVQTPTLCLDCLQKAAAGGAAFVVRP